MTPNSAVRFAAVSILAGIFASSADAQQDQVARGQYLVTSIMGCGNCHTPRGPDLLANPNLTLAGGVKFDLPFGTAYSKNVTPDPETGIGTWSNTQIVHAIREGLSREGAAIGPPMPVAYFNKLSDDDANAVAAYLRTVKPIRNEVPESKYRIPIKSQPPVAGHPAPPKTDKVAYGEYLANIGHCFECHTAPEPEATPGAGGRAFILNAKKPPIVSPNITSDPDTGLGNWTDDEIKQAITRGVEKGGRQLIPQMPYPYFKNMTAEDVEAIVAFLRTVPPTKNRIPQNPSLQSYLQ